MGSEHIWASHLSIFLQLSIYSEHFYRPEHLFLSIFIDLSIYIWAYFSTWAFLSEHIFPPEHIYLSIFFHLSIISEHFCWTEHQHMSIFFKLSIFKNAFPLRVLFKINHSRSLKDEVIFYSVVCTGLEPNILLKTSVSASNNICL